MPPASARPVIPGFHPDPSVCRVGDDFYLVNSSFEYAPGVPIFHSRDLRSWEQIGNVLDRPGQLDVSTSGPSGGIFAPTIRHARGRFWMITTNWFDGGGHLIVWAERPEGPWSDPVRIPSLRGIDPDLAWEDDGTCLMTYTGQSELGAGIHQVVIDAETGSVLDGPWRLWSGTGGKFPEGPHVYRIGEHWYLLIAEGGTERGHSVSIARGPSARGPFEGGPGNPILTARGTDLPVQSVGHADLVERPDGTWAMVYHGTRPRGGSPEWHVLGRETFAAEVAWEDGWPVVGEPIEPAIGDAPVMDELASGGLGPQWCAASHHPSRVLRPDHDGWRLTAGDAPVFVGRRQEHAHITVVAALDVPSGSMGALSLRIDPRHAVEVESDGATARAVWAIGDVRHVLGEHRIGSGDELAIEVRPAEGEVFSTERGPDVIAAQVITADGATVDLGRIDGRYVSTEVAGGMTGRMAGVVAVRGDVAIRALRYAGTDTPPS